MTIWNLWNNFAGKRFYRGRPLQILHNFPYPRVVLHAASFGELTGVFPVAEGLINVGFEGTICFTTGTPTGYERACRFCADCEEGHVLALPAPFECPGAVDNFIDLVKPEIFVCFEAEYWPLLLYRLRKRGITSMLFNGRVSDRSFKVYRMFRLLFESVFRGFAFLGMSSEIYRKRIIALGAHPSNTFVTGNSKYEKTIEEKDDRRLLYWKDTLELHTRRPVMVAGNLRGREYSWIARVVKRFLEVFPHFFAILAPRHMNRLDVLEAGLSAEGVKYQHLSDIKAFGDRESLRASSAIIVDSIGNLKDLYGLGDIIFCGGTIEPVGGHNILEPVVWGKKVFCGPFVGKIRSEYEFLERMGAVYQVRSDKDMIEKFLWVLKTGNPLEIEREKLKKIFEHFQGAAKIYVTQLINALGMKKVLA